MAFIGLLRSLLRGCRADVWYRRKRRLDINLPALRVLCVEDDLYCGLPMKLRDLEKLTTRNRFERLCGICDRLQFIGQLRHTLSLVVSTQEHQKAQYQFDRLVTYLTATCIESATQEGKGFEEYDKWPRGVGRSRSPRR